MAIASTMVWEVRPGGNDANGGGFDPGVASPGTDFSVQDAAQIAFTDLVIGATTTQLTSAAHPFDSTSPGNVINITGGAGFTTGWYEILSVSGSTATMDRSVGTGGSTGGTGNLGGGFTTLGQAGALHVSGNTIFFKGPGTYGFTTTTTNVSGGRLALTQGVNPTNPTRLVGYSTTRTIVNTDSLANLPVIQANAGLTGFTYIYYNGTQIQVRNVQAKNPNNIGSCNGFQLDNGEGYIERCTADGLVIGIWFSFGVNEGFDCRATNCTDNFNIGGNGALLAGCTAKGASSHNFSLTNNCLVAYCIADSGSSYGFFISNGEVKLLQCSSYNNSGHGVSGAAGTIFVNVVSYGNGADDFTLGGTAYGKARMFNCAGVNVSSDWKTTLNNFGFVTLSANPFTNAAGGDFSLNNTAGGGAACRSAGYPQSYFNLSTTASAFDIGASDHADPASTGSTIVKKYILVR